MGQLNSEQRVLIVEQYYSNRTQTKVKRVFANELNLDINIKTVSKLVCKWRANGTAHNLNKGSSRRSNHGRRMNKKKLSLSIR